MFKILVVIICVVGCALAACPLFETVPNLDLGKQIGSWQIHGILRQKEPIGALECLQVGITGENLGVAPVILKGHVHGTNLETGATIMFDAAGTVINLQRPGRWNVAFQGLSYVGSVIYTDYIEYSLLALCNEAGTTTNLDVLFLSRYHDAISNSTRDFFLTTLKNEYQLDGTNYRSIFHSHMKCGH